MIPKKNKLASALFNEEQDFDGWTEAWEEDNN